MHQPVDVGGELLPHLLHRGEEDGRAPLLWWNQSESEARHHPSGGILEGLSTTIMKTTKTKKATKSYRTHDEATVESFRRDPKFAAAYINAVLNDGDRAEIMTALRYVTDAFGGVPAVAQKTDLNPTTLYRTLSAKGNPELKSFMEIMKAVGMRILVEPLSPARR